MKKTKEEKSIIHYKMRNIPYTVSDIKWGFSINVQIFIALVLYPILHLKYIIENYTKGPN